MPTLPMKIGVPLDEMSILFFASLGAAIWLVYLFCQRKFAEPSNKGNGEFIYQLLPRQLATGEEYSHGFTIYFGSMALMVVLLSLLGASNLEQFGIALQKKFMEAKVAAYRTARASDPYYTDEGLRRDIVDNLYKLYILLGCAVRLKAQPNDDIDLVLRPFGFKLTRTPRRPGNGDLKLVSLAAVAVSATLLGLAAEGLGWFRLWQMSDVYPQTVLQPFLDAASTLVPHAIAIVIADLMRRRALNKGSWFVAAGHQQRGSVANYVRVAGWCGVAGYLGLVLWGLTQGPPTPASFKIEIPNALLAMVTGGFYVYHLDNAETGQRPSRAWELGSESVLTGLCGLIAACATWQITWQVAGGMDKVILTTVINAAVGVVFASDIPQTAAPSRLY